MKTRSLYSVLALLLAFALLAGCGPAPEAEPTAAPPAEATQPPAAVEEPTAEPQAEPAEPKVLRDGSLLDQDLSGLDPQVEMSLAMYGVARSVYSTLVRLGYEGDLELYPDLAESWDVSDDGLSYTFHLRQGVKFHTGQELTAEDVKFTFERLYDPAMASPAAMFGTFIVGVDERLGGTASDVPGIVVVDKYTVQFNLSQPYGAFLAELVTPSLGILSKEEVEKWGVDYLVHPSGTGPFKLKDWVRGEKLVLEANEDYYEGRPTLDMVEIIIVEDEATGILKFENGELDVYDVPSAELDRLMADPKWKDQIISVPALDTYYFQLNNFSPPLDDYRVRRAIAHAIDRQAILDTIIKTGQVANTVMPPGLPCYNPSIAPYEYDPEKSRALLKEAGLEDGFTMKVLERAESEIVDAIVAQLAEVGITVEQEMVERSAFWDIVYKGQTDSYYLSWWADFGDPHNFFNYIWRSATETEESKNMYVNPEVDELIDLAAVTTDMDERCELYHQIEQIGIEQDAQRVWLWHLETQRIVQPWVKGYNLAPTDVVFYYPIDIESH
ncbi:MAG TPA: ABC transporter substrate-binding protein [Anaerolineae bacterium]|nr:ABC transporter substrate-binding protein [Anaerolineae bacterium]